MKYIAYIWYIGSKTPKGQSHSNWCHRTESAVSVRAKYGFEPISIIIPRTIRIYRAKRLDWASNAATFFISSDRFVYFTRIENTQDIDYDLIIQDDGYWWQARKEFERVSRAGLIPSRALQERRIIHERTKREASGDTISKTWSEICLSICFLFVVAFI